MGKRVLLNVWLAIALLALVWVVWKEPGHAPNPPVVKLTALSPAAVNRIVITNHNGTITLIKQAGAWRLSQPAEVAANGVRVDDVLEVLQTESLSRFPAAGRDLSEYGLAKPAVRLRLNDTEILFGGLTPVDQQRYVQLGDTIHLIADRYMFELTGDATAWVSRNLVPPGKQIVSLQLPDRKLSRNDKGEWSVTPADTRVSTDAIQGLVNEWSDAQALRVGRYEKHAAQGEVVIGVAGQAQPLRYQIIARKPELILARPEIGMQFYVASEQADRLLSVKTPKPEAAAPKKN
jgi:Domain of unknown function (DUF4340)